MSVHESTLQQLKDMGIDGPLARAAALRFTSADAAVNWCFSDAGQNWTPEDDKKPAPPAPLPNLEVVHGPGVTVSHNEVAATSATSSVTNSPNPFAHHNPPVGSPPPIPPRKVDANLSAPFATKNPFRNNPPPPPITIEDDEDEDLRKAIAMSQEGLEDGSTDPRQERERSVRASGVPPPSPEGKLSHHGDAVFGPTDKEDAEGKMAMVPSTPAPTANISKEDEELNRAIADSLMTASFHSASALQDTNKPKAGERAAGVPLVFFSESGSSTYAAYLLQGLLSVPQFRETIGDVIVDDEDTSLLTREVTCLQGLIDRSFYDDADFIEVDQMVQLLRGAHEPSQYPPGRKSISLHERIVQIAEDALAATYALKGENLDIPKAPHFEDPASLFRTRINSDTPRQPSFIQIARSEEFPFTDLRAAMASLLWASTPNATVEEFGDILTVQLVWRYDAPKEPWDIQESITMDRFLATNAARSVGIRAQQGVAAGNARRLKEKIDKLVTHRGESTIDSLETLVKHYETSPAVDDPVRTECRSEVKSKLQHILENLQTQKSTAEEQLKKEIEASGSLAFNTDTPDLNQHVFVLRAVMFHDGVTVPGQHLYMYTRHEDDTWWKIQEHQATPVDFETIKNDRTGLFMEGGPYLLLYSRQGDRPSKTTPSADAAPAEFMRSQPDSAVPVADSQDTLRAETDDLMSFDEIPPNETASQVNVLAEEEAEPSAKKEEGAASEDVSMS